MNGSEFYKQIVDVRNPQLSAVALKVMLDGSVPAFLDELVSCYTEAVIDGSYYRCTYKVMPQYLSVGTDDDFIQWPLSIRDLQAFCDAHMLVAKDGSNVTKWFIPTKKLIENTWRASTCKIEPQTTNAWQTGDMTHPVRFKQEQDLINAAMAAKGCPKTAFSRAKKAYISAPNVVGTGGPTGTGVLHFTGWYHINGSCIQCGDATGSINGSPGHESEYSDYSHGCDLVFWNCVVNGEEFTFDELCNHPKLWVLVSDQGAFNPRFPNSGEKALPVLNTTTRMPPAAPKPADYKGSQFVTAGGTVKMSVAGTAPGSTPASPYAGQASGADYTIPKVLLGLGVLSGLAYLAFRKPKLV